MKLTMKQRYTSFMCEPLIVILTLNMIVILVKMAVQFGNVLQLLLAGSLTC